MLNKLMIVGFLFSIVCLALPQAALSAQAEAPPDATVDFDVKQYDNLFSKGRTALGTLHFKGGDYPFTVRIESKGSVSGPQGEGTGTVHGLRKTGDFLGKYTPVKGAAALRNSKGVMINFKSKSGAAPSGDVTAIVITFVGEVEK